MFGIESLPNQPFVKAEMMARPAARVGQKRLDQSGDFRRPLTMNMVPSSIIRSAAFRDQPAECDH